MRMKKKVTMDTSFFNSLFRKYIKNKAKNFERRKIEAAFK